MHASPCLLMCMIIVVSLAGCGPTVSAPTRTTATAARLGSAAAPLALATVLSQTVVPTRGGAVATTPSVSPASAVAPTIAAQSTTPPSVMAVALPDESGGIGFDDLRYDATLDQVLAPAGRTGNVDLVDPASRAVMPIAGFSAQPRFSGGHDDGPTSADAGHGLIFVTDRTTRRLSVVDPATRAIVASVALESSPDYVRYVPPTGELWVTEPDQEQIEVFTLPDAQKPMPERAAVITVKGGPESLVIDPQRQRAYTHLWAGATVAIDLKNRTLIAQWPNGCDGSRGIALDERRGWLFAGCAEGAGVVLDVDHDGQQLSNIRVGAGVDVIDYNPTLAHLYLPGATSATMAIVGVSASGTLSLLGTVATVTGAHCVAADTHGTAWVCDPDHGQLLRITDSFPAAVT